MARRSHEQAMEILDRLIDLLPNEAKVACPKLSGRYHIVAPVHRRHGHSDVHEIDVVGGCGCKWSTRMWPLDDCCQSRSVMECPGCNGPNVDDFVILHGTNGRTICWACFCGRPGEEVPTPR